jgi:poly(beta-D-mannuronate) lyase
MKFFLVLLMSFILWNGTLFAKNIIVKNETELIAANANAAPGDFIILKNGIWENISIKLTCNGLMGKPIYVKAETAGGVIIKGKSNLQIGGNWIVVEGLNFREGYSFVSPPAIPLLNLQVGMRN